MDLEWGVALVVWFPDFVEDWVGEELLGTHSISWVKCYKLPQYVKEFRLDREPHGRLQVLELTDSGQVSFAHLLAFSGHAG